MPTIFISYRRDDSGGHAGRLSDRLKERFGDDRVFMDVDAIDLGSDFRPALQSAVNRCDIMLVVIGRDWLGGADPRTGARRIDDPNDWVRIEIAEALKRDIPVVPVLVRGASLPDATQLPEDLQALPARQATTIADHQWRAGVDDLLHRLDAIPRRLERERVASLLARIGLMRLAIGLAAVAVLLGAIVWIAWPSRSTMPAVQGRLVADARSAIVAAGLTLPPENVKEEESLSTVAATVLRQEPAAGLRLSRGEPVIVVVAKAPPPVDLSPHVRIRDTGVEGSVAGLAAVTAIEVALARVGRLTRLSERYLYERARQHHEAGGEGTYLTAIVYVSEQFGVAPYTVWPYRPGEHTPPRGLTWRQLDAAAGEFKAEFHRIGVDGIYDQLRRGRAVMAGVFIGPQWTSDAVAKSGHIAPDTARDKTADGLAAITFVGFDPKTLMLRFAHSWGPQWGDKGFGTMAIATAKLLLQAQSIWAVDVASPQ
jgi:hypothetical protein